MNYYLCESASVPESISLALGWHECKLSSAAQINWPWSFSPMVHKYSSRSPHLKNDGWIKSSLHQKRWMLDCENYFKKCPEDFLAFPAGKRCMINKQATYA
jgi:hypothetical protein